MNIHEHGFLATEAQAYEVVDDEEVAEPVGDRTHAATGSDLQVFHLVLLHPRSRSIQLWAAF